MRKLLITGGAGFIGSAVVRLAIKLGFTVINVDNLTYASSLSNLTAVETSQNYYFEKVDLLENEALLSIFRDYQPNAVIHLAAETHVDRSINAPRTFIDTNVIGTFNLLEAARTYWIEQNRLQRFRFYT